MKSKKLFGILLTITMIIVMFSIVVNAQDAEALYGESADSLTHSGTLMEAFSSSSAKYIKLQSNVNLTSRLELWEGEKTVDLNGCTITAPEGDFAFFLFGGELDLIDTATETKGKVISSAITICVGFSNAYTPTLNIGNSTENSGGFTIETTATDPSYAALALGTSTSTVNVYQHFTVKGGCRALSIEYGIFNGNNIPFDFAGEIFNAGTISQLNATGYAEGNAIMVGGGSLHITGGIYKTKSNGIYMLGGEVKLEGGSFESESDISIFIDSSAGMTYADLLGEGYYYTNGDDVTEITDKEALALAEKLAVLKEPELEITDIEYNTLKIVFQSNLTGKTATVLFVDYAAWDDPTFRSAKIVPITTVKGENTLVLPSDVYLDAGDKIMIWENLTTIKPLCEAYRVSGRETPVKDTNPGIDLPIDYN